MELLNDLLSEADSPKPWKNFPAEIRHIFDIKTFRGVAAVSGIP